MPLTMSDCVSQSTHEGRRDKISHYGEGSTSSCLGLLTDATAVARMQTAEGKSRMSRWALTLQEYDYTIEHRPGNTNISDGHMVM